MRKLIASLLISTFLSLSLNAFADTTPEIKKFTVNPTTLRTQLFSGNISLLQALNNVENSKLNVSMARAKLLPSLNLGVLLPALANPTFLLSSVTILFPFLVPSNWAVLKQEKELFEADKASYKTIQLNMLSNALSLYFTFINDTKVQSIYVEQSDVLERIYNSLKKQSDVLGNVTSEDLNMAHAQWDEAKIRVSKLQELLIEEKAGLRTMLALPLGSEMVLEDKGLPASDFETKPIGEIAVRSLEVSPESMQLTLLVKAAKSGKFAKMMGFMNSASVAGTSTNNASPFEGLKAGGGFSIGADNLVNLKIANNNIESILLRYEQLKEENEKLAEVLSGKLIEVKEQQELSQSAYNERMKVFDGQKRQYELGLITLQTLLQTQSQLTDTRVNQIKTNLDLKMQRLTLQRLVVDGDFSLVKGCSADAPTEKRGIFHRKKNETLDELCKQ
jgi:multidrug efflux system outer membrane protein